MHLTAKEIWNYYRTMIRCVCAVCACAGVRVCVCVWAGHVCAHVRVPVYVHCVQSKFSLFRK